MRPNPPSDSPGPIGLGNATGVLSPPLLSIVIPALNEAGVVDRLLYELLVEATDDVEVIVADSGSTDDTAAIVEALAQSHPQLVRLVRAPRKGVSLARNSGAAVARGEYLAFLDADARISTTTLLSGVAQMRQRGLTTAALYFVSGSDCWRDRLIAGLFNMAMAGLQYLAATAPGSSGYLVRRSTHERESGFNEALYFGEDVDYLRRVSRGGRFRMLRQHRIVLDMRRFHCEGRLKLLGKMTYGTLAQFLNPELAKPPFEYSAGPVAGSSHVQMSQRTPCLLADTYEVTGRRPRMIPAEPASAGHFFKRPAGRTDLAALMQERGACITPYCLDDHRRRLLLVEVAPRVDLLGADPFFYEAQRDHAVRLHAVAYSDVPRLADLLMPTAAAPPPIFLHSTGRCGSTLLSQLLATTGTLQSVSEPDFYSQATILSRLSGGQRDRELRRLMDGCTRLLSHALRCRDPAAGRPLIKLRSWCLPAAPLFEPLSGRWHNVFLYRDPLPTVNSFLNAYFSARQYRLWRRWRLDRLLLSALGAFPPTRAALAATVPLFEDPGFRHDGRRGAAQYFTLQWLSHMQDSVRLQQQQPGFFSARIRYENLVEQPADSLRGLMSALGETVPVVSNEAIARLLTHNSQQGSRMQSKGEYLLSAQIEQEISALLASHPASGSLSDSPHASAGGILDAQAIAD
mgnify:CR=1 FL=1